MQEGQLAEVLACVRRSSRLVADAVRVLEPVDSYAALDALRPLRKAYDEVEDARDRLVFLVEDGGMAGPGGVQQGAGQDELVGALLDDAAESFKREYKMLQLLEQYRGLVEEYRLLARGAEVTSDGC